jgi:Flp pilus assembly protein TadG
MLKVHGPARARRTRPAAAAAELALLLPVLVLLAVVCTDFARLFYFYITVTNCARNGAIWASDSVARTTSPYTNVTKAALADAPDLSPTPTVSDPAVTGTDANGNGYVQVTVTYNASLITNYLGFSSITISRTVQMRQAPTVPN